MKCTETHHNASFIGSSWQHKPSLVSRNFNRHAINSPAAVRYPLKNSAATESSSSTLRAVEIIDLRISYQKGAPIAYIQSLTTQGRHWLWDHFKYPYAGPNAIVHAEQLLELIQQMDADQLTIHWQS